MRIGERHERPHHCLGKSLDAFRVWLLEGVLVSISTKRAGVVSRSPHALPPDFCGTASSAMATSVQAQAARNRGAAFASIGVAPTCSVQVISEAELPSGSTSGCHVRARSCPVPTTIAQRPGDFRLIFDGTVQPLWGYQCRITLSAVEVIAPR